MSSTSSRPPSRSTCTSRSARARSRSAPATPPRPRSRSRAATPRRSRSFRTAGRSASSRPKGNGGFFGGEPRTVPISLPDRQRRGLKTGSADIKIDGTPATARSRPAPATPSTRSTGRPSSRPAPATSKSPRPSPSSGSRAAPATSTSATADGNLDGLDRLRRRRGRHDATARPSSRPAPATSRSPRQRRHLAVDRQRRHGHRDRPAGKFNAKGASGDVQIGIPAGIPVWTDITTVTGSSTRPRGAGQPEAGSDYVELRAKTVSGDIQLHEV